MPPMTNENSLAARYSGDLFGELQLAESAKAQSKGEDRPLWPGIAACATAAAAAAWLADHYGMPIMLLGLLVGLSLNFISGDARVHRGLDLVGSTGLRIGIAVLGFQVTFEQIGALGALPFAYLLVVMSTTLAAGLLGARLTGQSPYAGLLAGGATAICGASAALALYGIIGRRRLPQAQFALTLAGISIASALAMSVYPALAAQIGLSDRQAGFLIGASIHDVAQAIGGGYAFSDAAGGAATVVKMARVALLAPVIALVTLFIGPADGADGRWSRLAPPWFILAFLGLVALNSCVAVPTVLSSGALVASKALLLLAVTATAMRTRLDLLLSMGWLGAIPVAAATLASFITALAFAVARI